MKKIFLILLSAFLMIPAFNTVEAQTKKSKAKTVQVKSYKTKKGKTVKTYKRSKPSRKR